MLSKKEIEEIRKRAKKATEGNPLKDAYVLARMNLVILEDVPALLAEIERLQAESTYWRMEHDHQRAQAELYLEKYKKAMDEIEDLELQRKADGEYYRGDSE